MTTLPAFRYAMTLSIATGILFSTSFSTSQGQGASGLAGAGAAAPVGRGAPSGDSFIGASSGGATTSPAPPPGLGPPISADTAFHHQGASSQSLEKHLGKNAAHSAQAAPGKATSGSGGFGMGALSDVLAACSNALSAFAEKNAASISEAANDYSKRAGFQPDPYINIETAQGVGSLIARRYGQSSGCQQFIDKNGNIGHWGRQIISQMDYNPNLKRLYEDKVPSDIGRYCPRFREFNDSEKKLFWVWFFASLAQPESSCDPEAANRNAPNGTAIGLFQLETKVCPNTTSAQLYQAEDNIECAVNLFAREMTCRDTITISCSKRTCPEGGCGTYWGPLRSETTHRGDHAGGQKFQGLFADFSPCHQAMEIREPATTAN